MIHCIWIGFDFACWVGTLRRLSWQPPRPLPRLICIAAAHCKSNGGHPLTKWEQSSLPDSFWRSLCFSIEYLNSFISYIISFSDFFFFLIQVGGGRGREREENETTLKWALRSTIISRSDNYLPPIGLFLPHFLSFAQIWQHWATSSHPPASPQPPPSLPLPSNEGIQLPGDADGGYLILSWCHFDFSLPPSRPRSLSNSQL